MLLLLLDDLRTLLDKRCRCEQGDDEYERLPPVWSCGRRLAVAVVVVVVVAVVAVALLAAAAVTNRVDGEINMATKERVNSSMNR
jgi:hypothetical protein